MPTNRQVEVERSKPRKSGTAASVAKPRAAKPAPTGQLGHGQDVRNRYDLCKKLIDMARTANPKVPPELLFMTIGIESSFCNNRGGDRDSVGLFQQRPSQGWGTPSQCFDPIHAASRFIKGAQAYIGKYGNDAASLGRWCQAVQRSGFPDRYQHAYSEARRIVAAVDAGKTPGGKDLNIPDPGFSSANYGSASGGAGGYGGGGGVGGVSSGFSATADGFFSFVVTSAMKWDRLIEALEKEGVSESDFLASNPGIKKGDGLKKGAKLNLPKSVDATKLKELMLASQEKPSLTAPTAKPATVAKAEKPAPSAEKAEPAPTAEAKAPPAEAVEAAASAESIASSELTRSAGVAVPG